MKKYIYGINPLTEALSSGVEIEKIWIKKSLNKKNISDILKKVKNKNIKISFVPDIFFNKFQNKSHQGVVALMSSIEYGNIEDIVTSSYERGESPIVVILNGITDVRNFGAIARTSLCAGANTILIENKNSVLISEDAIKTSAGALLHIPICRTSSLLKSITKLKEYGLQIVSCSEKGKSLLYEIDFRKPTAIILGDEDKGINPEIIKNSDYIVSIPMKNKITSLNVSVAAGIFLYEIKRQRLL